MTKDSKKLISAIIITKNEEKSIALCLESVKNIADENKIDPRRSASILDTISCFVQGVLPYGAQMLAALAVAKQQVTPFDIMANLWYPYLLGASTLLFILFRKRQV